MTECSCRTHPFLQCMAATDRARHPSGSSEWRTRLPVALVASPPQKNVGAASTSMGFAQNLWLPGEHQAPIRGWLVLQAIRFTADRGRRHGILFREHGWSPVSGRGLPVAVATFTRSSGSHQMAFAPSAYGNRHGPACAPGPCARALDSSWLSCARRTVWRRR